MPGVGMPSGRHLAIGKMTISPSAMRKIHNQVHGRDVTMAPAMPSLATTKAYRRPRLKI